MSSVDHDLLRYRPDRRLRIDFCSSDDEGNEDRTRVENPGFAKVILYVPATIEDVS